MNHLKLSGKGIHMKDGMQKLTTIIIALVVVKTMNFSNPDILDYIIMLLTVALLILMVVNWIRRG